EVADNITDILLRRNRLHLHDRLQENWRGLLCPFLEGHTTRDLKGHFAGVYLMVAAINQRNLYIHNRIASQYTTLHGFGHTLLHSRDIFTRHNTTDDLILKDKAATWLVWLHLQPDMPILAAATTLANKAPLDAYRAGDRLAIGHL